MAQAAPQAAVDPVSVITVDDCLAFLRRRRPDSVDLIVTDPGYSGMNQHLRLGRGRIVGQYREAGNHGAKWFSEFHDDPATFRVFLEECRRVLCDDRHIYIMFDNYSLLSLAPIVREFFAVKNVLVWDKVNLGMGHYFRRRHELIVFATKGRRKLRSRDRPDVIVAKRIHRASYPTQKPVAVFDAMIQPSTEPGFVVCDPFVGAGTAAISALKANCRFVGADLSEEAVRLANWRVSTFLETRADPLEGQRQLTIPV